MIRKCTVILFLKLLICSQLWDQNSITHPVGQMERRADSTVNVIDSLIASGLLLHFFFEYKQEGDTTKFYRHYFIDTVYNYLVKAIIDTSFQDYYKRPFKQAVIYFNQGYEFKNCYNEKEVPSSVCSYYNTYPEENETAQQLGKLKKGWSEKALDELVKQYVKSEIYHMKFMQKKHSNND